jgi:hypothetical protein
MDKVVLFSFTAAFNPTLVAATTVMLLLERPMRLMLGYLAGAMMTSITLGIVIVFALPNSGTTNTTENTISPVVDIVLGGLFLIVAYSVASGRTARIAERRREKKADKPDKGPPKWQQQLSKGSPRVTFAIGALLTLPGASYLAGLNQIHEQSLSTVETVLTVIGFNLIMMLLLEIPILCYAFAPDWTPGAIERAKAWVSRHAHVVAVRGLGAIGVLLVAKGVVGLL